MSTPPPNPRPILGRKLGAGIGYALAAHVLSIALGVGWAVLARDSDAAGISVLIILVGQLMVFLGCLAIGIIQLVQGDRGIGVGLLVGWAIGVLVLPVVGVGVCIAAMNSAGSL